MWPAAKILVNILLVFYYILKAFVVFWIPVKYRSKNISGQIALVTGAGGAIGRQLAIALSNQGCTVICWDVAKQANEETARIIKKSRGEAYAYQVDLTKRESIYATAKRVKDDVGKVTILVNNAGVLTGKLLLDIPDEVIERTLDVNALAHFWTVKSFLPDMIMEDCGHIVTVASFGGLAGIGSRATDYTASKFAAVGFMEALRTELEVNGRHSIKTTLICPSLVDTPMATGVKLKIPLLQPEEVAKATINAILTEQAMALVPSHLNFLVLTKTLLPVEAQLQICYACGMKECMDNFVGRKEPLI